MKTFKYFIYPVVLILLFAIYLNYSKSKKTPIKIGLLVTLTGKSPELGREIRDGVLIAVEEINQRDGINGRKIELIIKDIKSDPEIAKVSVMELITDEVEVIVGPDTSTIARAIVPIINKHKILTISPTVSSTEFFMKDDYFITLEPSNRKFGTTLAKFINEKLKPARILIIHDKRNPVYTADFVGNFIELLDKKIKVDYLPIEINISDFDSLVKETLRFQSDVVLLVTDVLYASVITQKIRHKLKSAKIIICPWAKFNSFMNYAGELSEGVFSIGYYEDFKNSEDFLIFKDKFIKIFGYEPEFPSINGYNSLYIIKEAYIKKSNQNELKDRILGSNFTLPFIDISINRYGDAEIETFVVQIRNQKYERIKE